MRLLFRLAPCLLLVAGCRGGDGAPPTSGAETDAAADTLAYTTYRNERFGFQVAYPAALLSPEPPPANDDGRRFVSPDDAVVMTASGRHDVRGLALDTLVRQAWADLPTGPDAPDAYEARRADGFVVSTSGDGRIHYRRVLRRDGRLLTLTLTYPADRRTRFDPVVEHVSASFSAVGE